MYIVALLEIAKLDYDKLKLSKSKQKPWHK